MLPPKDALIEHQHKLEEWSEQCKWWGRYGLYDWWQPIVIDFYKSFILKKLLNEYLQIQIDVLNRVKDVHKEDHRIREFCKKSLDNGVI